MSWVVFAAVLLAALLHAGWNAVVKVGGNRFTSILSMGLFQAGIAVLLLPFFSLPVPAAWPWVLLGSTLHTGYKLFLIRAYEHGDLSQVYPLARGTAPLIVALVSATFIGETPTTLRIAAILSIAAGIMMMAKPERGAGAISRKGLLLTIGTAAFTASYTIADGVGARIAGSASSFVLWMIFLDGLFMLAFALSTRGTASLKALLPSWRAGLATGGMSMGSYWIAVWAFTQAPLALIAALRETSVLFAMLIAVFVLKEKVGPWRWFAAGLILTGIALMRL